MAKKWFVALAALALFASACSSTSSDAADVAGSSTDGVVAENAGQVDFVEATEEPGVEAEVAGQIEEPGAEPAEDSDDERPEAFGERCGNDQLPLFEQAIVIADGGLRARQLPGDGEVISVLPNGTVLDHSGEGNACGVMADGSVWLEIGTPLLATGGWVHSDFLEPVDERLDEFGERCGNDQLPVLEQMAVAADGGLNARRWAGDGDVLEVLPDATVVDTFGEGESCTVLADGSVWFEIGSPLLPIGGWVHSGFLEPTDETGATGPSDDERPEAFGEICGNDQLPVFEQAVVVANSGLRARQLPGTGEVISVLPNGTIVDISGEGLACGVMADGSVWFDIGTPLLATGGWVHSGFLDSADD